jgi:hypothetical protein
MAETQPTTGPATAVSASTPKQQKTTEINLSQMYTWRGQRFGPGLAQVPVDAIEDLEAAQERHKAKLPMGADDAHERPDGSQTIIHPDNRNFDTQFANMEAGEALVEGNEKAEEERAEQTQDIVNARKKKVEDRKKARGGHRTPTPKKEDDNKGKK